LCKSAGLATKKLLTGTGSTPVATAYTVASFKAALLQQPLIIGFAVVDSFYYYTSGVYKPTDCVGAGVNHAMQAVGFGVDVATSLPYAIVRN
jgi:Papain family cysteine protease